MSIFLLLIAFFLACKEEPKTATFTTDAPESIIREWQSLVDSNKFDAAKLLSTARTTRWLEKTAKLSEKGDVLAYQMSFTKIDCEIKGDSAHCDCTFRMTETGDSSTFKEIYILKKNKDKWLIDLEQDEAELFN